MTGNTKRFFERNNIDAESIDGIFEVKEPFVIATGTINFGEVPGAVDKFLENNKEFLRGVIAGGNKNWGNNFAKAGDIISEKYNVPLLLKIELHGKESDYIKLTERMKILETY